MLTRGSLIVMSKVWFTEPPLLFANSVNGVVVKLTCGVPERTPFTSERPCGRAGWMPHSSTTPPLPPENTIGAPKY